MSYAPEQQAVIDKPPNTKMLVTAGPGTGKTHTLVGRLVALVEGYGLSPGSELLVLSFSRAAVREVRTRVKKAEGDVRYVKAYTFDSFASRLLTELLPDSDWKSQNYDGRIKTAAQVILTFKEAATQIGGYRHILVDEVQDLVGVRAELVKAILDKASIGTGGWTLFGDPAQGIYNFQLEGGARKIGSAALYQWLRTRFRNDLKEFAFATNHRAQSEAFRPILLFGAAINAANPNYRDISVRLKKAFSGLEDFGLLKAASTLTALKERKSTAILCRNNGQALFISRRLYEYGVPHAYQRRATDRALPGWIGALFNDYEGRVIDKETFVGLVEERLPGFEAAECFDLLRRTGIAKGKNALDLELLATRIRERLPLDDLCEQPRHHLVVSTIHRAKGLEFDRVVVVWDERPADKTDDLEEETRVLYVALTRPRQWLYRLAMPSHKGFLCKQNDGERWARKFDKWKIGDYELLGDDTHELDPAGGFLIKCPVKETQDYILRNVKPHDPLVLHRLNGSGADGTPRVHYSVAHNERPVGVTSDRFGADMFRMLKLWKGWEVRWPERIDNLRVEAIDTVAGSALRSEHLGLGRCGFWLRVRVAGLGRLRFSAGEELL